MKKLRGIVFAFILTPLFLTACGNKQKPIIPPYQADVSLLTYDTTTVEYDLPDNLDNDSIVIESSDESLFTIKNCFPEKSKVVIESNLNNKVGTADLNFVDGEEVVYSLSVAVNYPLTLGQAYDAVTLAIIKLPAETEFQVTFNFENKMNYEEFDEALEIYGRRATIGYLYHTGTSVTNSFICSKEQSYATESSDMTDQQKFTNVTSLNYKSESTSQNLNEEKTFYIDEVERELEVRNSEELFWAVEHGYKPNFDNANQSCENIYDKAKTFCLDIPEGEPLVRFREIFDKLNEITWYDQGDFVYPWYLNKSYFLDGVFSGDSKNGIAVCDGFSKAYALICGILGLPCFRSYGFPSNPAEPGHAWNYVKLDGKWYLVCPTWIKLHVNPSDELSTWYGEKISLPYYDAFLAGKDFFKNRSEDGDNDYSDLAFPDIKRSDTRYQRNIFDFNYHVTSDTVANSINSHIDNIVTSEIPYCVYITFNKNESPTNVTRMANKVANGIGSDRKIVYYPLDPDFITCWVCFKNS